MIFSIRHKQANNSFPAIYLSFTKLIKNERALIGFGTETYFCFLLGKNIILWFICLSLAAYLIMALFVYLWLQKYHEGEKVSYKK